MPRAKVKAEDAGGDASVAMKLFAGAALFVLALAVGSYHFLGAGLSPQRRGDRANAMGSEPSVLSLQNDVDKAFSEWPKTAMVDADTSLVGLVKHEGVGFALQAQSSVKGNRTLISVPYASCLSVGHAVDDKKLGPALLALKDKVNDIVKDSPKSSGFEGFALLSFILQQQHLGSDSFWSPWFKAAVPNRFDNDLYWSYAVGKNCLHQVGKTSWERSLRHFGIVLKSITMAASESPAYSAATGVVPSGGTLTEADKDRVRWALSVMRTRGWDRAAPVHMLVVPLFDLVDLRVGVNRSSVTAASKEINAATVFDDDSGRVHLVSVEDKLQRKGTYVTTSYSNPRMLQDSMRLYGFVDKEAAKFLSYAEYKIEELAEKEPGFKQLPRHCLSSRALFFDLRTGEPSSVLKECFRAGAGDGAKGRSLLLDHIKVVLSSLHTEKLLQQCVKVAETKVDPSSKDYRTIAPHGASGLVEQETLLRAGFQRALVHVGDLTSL